SRPSSRRASLPPPSPEQAMTTTTKSAGSRLASQKRAPHGYRDWGPPRARRFASEQAQVPAGAEPRQPCPLRPARDIARIVARSSWQTYRRVTYRNLRSRWLAKNAKKFADR